jgi:hypothetical protein
MKVMDELTKEVPDLAAHYTIAALQNRWKNVSDPSLILRQLSTKERNFIASNYNDTALEISIKLQNAYDASLSSDIP